MTDETSRRGLLRGLLALVSAAVAWAAYRGGRTKVIDDESSFDRVLFVCRNSHGEYSPAVYLHGAAGGGPACLDDVRSAARSMRAGEVYDSAAGLCGELFAILGATITSGGGLSLRDAPTPGPGGEVDWQGYCGWPVDLVLVDVDRGTAECFVSPAEVDAPEKRLAARIDGLVFGG